jgi:predicted nucleic acid-binding protein
MILYLETSNLMKLYADEPGTKEVQKSVQDADVVATSIVAYPETRAAFARKLKEKAIRAAGYRGLKDAFEADWGRYFVLFLGEEIARLAGDMAEKHGLRGFDAIHLASALSIKKEVSATLVFSSADARLSSAAAKEGLKT